jgi:hypothetical protein
MLVDDPEVAERLRRRTVANLRGWQARTVVRRQMTRSWRRRFLVAALILFPTVALAATWAVLRTTFVGHPNGKGDAPVVAKVQVNRPAPEIPEIAIFTPATQGVKPTDVRQDSVVAGREAPVRVRSAKSGVVRASSASSASTSSAVAFADATSDVTSRSTLAAENGLMQAAMARARNGDDVRAAALFGDFLARYPRSPLSQNAEVERFRCLERLGDGRAAARLARRSLGGHPDGMAEDEARRLAAPASSARP